MNPFLHDWNFECDLPLGPNHELMELMYRNGQVVAQSQTHQRPSPGPTRLDPIRKLQKQQQQFDGSYVDSDILGPDTTASWIEHPVQDSFKEFSSHFLMLHDPMETDKPTKQFEEVVPQQPNKPKHCFDPKPPMPPPPRIQLDSSHSFGKVANFTQFSAPTKLGGQVSGDRSVITVGSSHGSNNRVVNGPGFSRATSSNGLGYGSQFFGNKEVPKTVLHEEGRKQETMEPTLTSSSGRTESSFGGMNKNSAGADSLKRKGRDVEDSECLSEAAELESAGGKKSVQQSGSARKSRAAEVHNQSERRRRDRINKKMRALQELIPHCNKTDKASMLDEAIEYLKSLQMQLQVMWMGGGMAPMMFPGMQHYMSPMGMGMARHSLSNGMNFPGVSIVDQSVNMAASASNPNMMCQTPILNPVNLQNQMQTHSFPEQFARYMGMHQMQSATTSQPMNMFGFGPQSIHPTQVNVSGPPSSSIDALGGNKMG